MNGLDRYQAALAEKGFRRLKQTKTHNSNLDFWYGPRCCVIVERYFTQNGAEITETPNGFEIYYQSLTNDVSEDIKALDLFTQLEAKAA